MSIPAAVQVWLDEHYPRPRVDPEWLEACYAWLTTERSLSPAINLPALLSELEEQLLKSDLNDSMLHGSGLPPQFASQEHIGVLTGPPVLVEIIAISEVGVSAFQLDQIRQARDDRLAAGATEDPNDQDGEGGDVDVLGEGPVPKYPRSMLSFVLSDGNTVIRGMEYRPLKDLALGKTKLGYKLQLKGARIHRGIVFLEPACVVLKGHETADREAEQRVQFAQGLRARMGLPIDPINANAPPAAPAAVPPQQPQPQRTERTPLREISPPPSPPLFPQHDDDAALEPRRRKVPSGSNVATTSRYWGDNSANGPPPGQRKIAGRLSSATTPARGTGAALGLQLPPTTRSASLTTTTISDDYDNIPVDDFDFDLIDEIMGDENRAPATPPPPPAQPRPVVNNYHDITDLDSDSYDNDPSLLDVEVMEALDKSEREAVVKKSLAAPASSSASHPPSSGSSGLRSSSRLPKAEPSPFVSRPLPTEVIEIESDEEMEDKENVPVATRHVRRRVMGNGGGTFEDRLLGAQSQTQRGEASDDVINISDSD